MPTTPNPTPPTTDPATGVPAPPVYDTTQPDMLGTSATATKTQLGYVDHNYDTNLYRSPYYNTPAINSVPGTVFLDDVCPGRWSRRYYTASDAASLSGGSGYFGYDTSDQNHWWSTNFIDDGDASCTTVSSGGQYYSKNVTIDSTHILMGVVTVEGSIVKLTWGSTWGLVTKNALFDYLDSNTTYVPRTTTIPRTSTGTVDVTALNASVMKYAPTRGCFVMFDMSTNVVLYTMMDGEQKQFAGSQSGSVAPALALRTATDPNSLPLTSNLTGLPTFVSGQEGPVATSLNFTLNGSLSTMDYSTPWLKSFTGFQDGTSSGFASASSLAAAQVSPQAIVLSDGGSSFYSFASITVWGKATTKQAYSGWLRAGSATQCVGWVLQVNGVAAGRAIMMCTPYGFTSVSPVAVRTGAGSTYLLTTSNVQTEIASFLYVGGSVGGMGFVYDASVGPYGQVTWISQI